MAHGGVLPHVRQVGEGPIQGEEEDKRQHQYLHRQGDPKDVVHFHPFGGQQQHQHKQGQGILGGHHRQQHNPCQQDIFQGTAHRPPGQGPRPLLFQAQQRPIPQDFQPGQPKGEVAGQGQYLAHHTHLGGHGKLQGGGHQIEEKSAPEKALAQSIVAFHSVTSSLDDS
ncbi:hypothetical protein B5F22_08220 [Pseudoflavonifractor sp. An187]|nr:hypothetical protein B5F22_08220 [Pseudoflavonifractor sp. An187]